MIGPIIFNAIVFVSFVVYYYREKEKALNALDIAIKTFKRIVPFIGVAIIAIIFINGIFSVTWIKESISTYTGFFGYVVAGLLGAIIHIPPLIAFPISGELLQTGVDPGMVAVFVTTLVMVHTFTIPIEIKELGFKFAFVRNLLSFIFAIVIGILIGVLY